MKPYILGETNWKTVKDQHYEVAVLPWGATEAHNFHLPYGADAIEADRLSAEAANLAWEKGAKVIVLPVIPYGVNTGQAGIKLDMNIYPSTQFAILNDIIEVLNRHGIYKLLVMNSHGGNDFKPLLRELGAKYTGMFLCCCDWYHSVKKEDFFEHSGDHADEMETSLLLYWVPEFVLPLSEAGDGKEKKIKIQAVNEGWAWTERKWTYVTTDTGIGYPGKASAAKGKNYFEIVAAKLSQLIIEIAETDMKNMYG